MTCFVVSIVVIGEKASKYRDDRRYRDLPSHVTIMFDHVSPTRRHIGCHPHKFVSYHHTSSGRAKVSEPPRSAAGIPTFRTRPAPPRVAGVVPCLRPGGAARDAQGL